MTKQPPSSPPKTLTLLLLLFICLLLDSNTHTHTNPNSARFFASAAPSTTPATAKKPSQTRKGYKDWTKVNYAKLEEDWEDGDSHDELQSEDTLLHDEITRRKETAVEVDAKKLKGMKPGEAREAIAKSSAGAGPTMMFVELRDDASPHTEEYKDRLGSEWSALLQTAGIEVSFYNVEGSKMLVSIKKGWLGKEIQEFLLGRGEVEGVTWNSHEIKAERSGEEL